MLLLLFRLSGCLFSWMEERQSDSRESIDAKKAQWRRELGKHTQAVLNKNFKYSKGLMC